ncbi:Der1-like family-domain-containing protein [Catenaria anguillulae PL171]|uniref:Derlin n=1 Tax=Catenaria anguillulae PL171 TaxID=765915 RepID=A0A1Y2HG38_9FUNG|nr:Der1-like family-domain-containing protein [Catenaria anguillulae PL171]
MSAPGANVHTPGGAPSGNPVTDFLFSLPPITRVLFASTVATTLAANFLFPIPKFLLLWPHVTINFEIWRLLTCFFVGKLGFNWAMNLYFLYRNSLDLERGKYAGRSADFAVVVVLVMLFSLVTAYFFDLLVLTDPLMMALVYLWSNDSPHTPVGFMFGMQFQAMYLPWVLAGWDLLMTGAVPTVKLLGIVIGHAVHWITDIYPAQNGGRRLVPTPEWMRGVVGDGAGAGPTTTGYGFGVQPPARGMGTGARQGGFTAPAWRGAGRRLGE